MVAILVILVFLYLLIGLVLACGMTLEGWEKGAKGVYFWPFMFLVLLWLPAFIAFALFRRGKPSQDKP